MLEEHASCKLIKKTTAGTAVLENIIVRNGKKYGCNKVSYNYLGSPTQEDHNIHTFFILFSCFSWGKFRKTLVPSNV